MSPRKRSNAPIFWLLFGAGGMLSALLGSMLVVITGIAVPLGAPLGMDYAHLLAFARHPIGKAFVFALVMFFAFHAAHRLLCSLHDVGIHKGLAAKSLCYGFALLLTLVAGSALIGIGF